MEPVQRRSYDTRQSILLYFLTFLVLCACSAITYGKFQQHTNLYTLGEALVLTVLWLIFSYYLWLTMRDSGMLARVGLLDEEEDEFA